MKKGLVIHHNGPPALCVGQPHDRCERFWRAVRDYHVNTKGWSDIAYSFGVCPHGQAFVGRGWFKNQFANGSDDVGVDDGRDSEWFTVLAFVGGGSYAGTSTGSPEERVTPEMERGIVSLVALGRGKGYCGDRVLPHNVFKRKVCPGPTLIALAAHLDNGATSPPITDEGDDEMVVLSHFRTKAGSNENIHTYRVSGNVASWCGTQAEIAAAEFFGAKWFGPLEPSAWQSLAVINGPLANQDRR
jgi:hypothetical protein